MIMYTPGGYCFLQLREKVRSTMEEIVPKALTGEEEKMDYILGKPAKPTKFDCYNLQWRASLRNERKWGATL